MTVEINGLKIEYTRRGSGKIPVLLLHGWGCNYELYGGLISALEDRCDIFALNFPGCGGSDIMKTPWNVDDYCELVVEFTEKLDIVNPILIGHSHGGRVILSLAGRGKLKPQKIVLLGAAGLIPKKTFKQRARANTFKSIKRLLTLPVVRNYSGSLLEKARKHYGSADYNAAPPVLRQTMVSLVNTDLRELLPSISCPTLLIWGENDTAAPLETARIMEKLIPDAGLCVIKNAGHFAFCEKPFEVNAILRSFIK